MGWSLPAATSALRRVDFGLAEIREKHPVLPHELVANGHELAVHFGWRLVDADGVAEGLGHLLHAVEAFEDRRHEDDLRLLAVVALQLAAHQEVEFLVRAAEFDIGFQGN
jgi:hypothetical protein